MISTLLQRVSDALAGRYAIQRQLAQGGMATVFLAHDLRHDRPVAIKVLEAEIASVINAERFLREIRIAARLQHPHILPLHDSGNAGGLLYFVMPYVAGESLRHRLQRGPPLGLEEALRIAREVADALAHAHEHGVVHRDIKPGNILLVGEHAVVSDFGIARAVSGAAGDRLESPRDPAAQGPGEAAPGPPERADTLTEAGRPLGTPAYMSPEQVANASDLDARSDIYSLGCVVYEMLAGAPPFGDGPSGEVMARHSVEAPAPLRARRPDLPPELEAAVLRAMAKRPGDRFQTAGALRDALVVSERPPLAAGQPRRIRDRLVLTVGLMLPVVLAAVWTAWPRAQKPAAVGDANRVVVLPFRVSGRDSTLAFLREGMVDLLAARFNGEIGPRAVDPLAALTAWRAVAPGAGSNALEGAWEKAAAQLNAGRIVQGSVVGSPARLVLTAHLLNLGDRKDLGATASGPLDSLPVLVDRLAGELLSRSQGEVEERMPSLTTSLPALRAYLEGKAEYRRGRYREAIDYFDRALRLDSALAPAALAALIASSQGPEYTVHTEVKRLAWGSVDRLSPHDRLLLRAFAEPPFTGFPNGARRLAVFDSVVRMTPDRADLWYLLGDQLYHFGPAMGLADADTRSLAAFEHSLQLDSAFAPAVEHLVDLAAESGDSSGARAAGERYLGLGPTADKADYVRWRVALATRDSAALRELRTRFGRMPPTSLQRIVGVAQLSGVELADADSALAVLRRGAARSDERSDGWVGTELLRLVLAANEGRTAEAREAAAAVMEGSWYSAQPFSVWQALFWDGDPSRAEIATRELVRELEDPRSDLARLPHDRLVTHRYRTLCWVAEWQLEHGATAAARRVINRLARARADTALPEVFHEPVCVPLLRVGLAFATGAPGAARLLRQQDSVARVRPSFSALTPAMNLVLARLWEQQGDRTAALAAVRRRDRHWLPSGLFFLSTFLREEGRLATLTGDTTGAMRAYRHYLALRADPDPALRPERDRIRATLASLERGASGR